MAYHATQYARANPRAEFRITSQLELEILFSKHQLLPRIRAEFIDAGMVEQLEKHNILVHFGLDLLAQMVLHKRTTIPVLVGILLREIGMCRATRYRYVGPICNLRNHGR